MQEGALQYRVASLVIFSLTSQVVYMYFWPWVFSPDLVSANTDPLPQGWELDIILINKTGEWGLQHMCKQEVSMRAHSFPSQGVLEILGYVRFIS